MRRIAVCLCTLLLPLPAAGQANPLAPLAKLHTALTKGLGAVMKGTDAAKAFKPLAVKVRPGLLDAAKEAGGVTARILGMEIELIFYSGETASYYLRTQVYPAKRGPVLLEFKGRPTEGAKGLPFAKYSGIAAPLGAAGALLAKIAVGPACAKLPVATPADFPFMPPGKLTERMAHLLKFTRHHIAEECTKLAELEKPTRVELHVDDVAFGVLGADGKLVGTVKGELELDRAGALTLELGHFKRVEAPPPPPPPPPRRGHHRPHPRPGEPAGE